MENILQEKIDFSILKNVKVMNNFIQSNDIDSEYTGHKNTVESFGSEWNTFTHNSLSLTDCSYYEYFDIFPLNKMSKDWTVVDVGCGTGRWARRVAPYVKMLYGVDPSEAINVFINNTKENKNIIPVKAYAENLPFQASSIDLVLCYGVLHHIEQTEKSIYEIQRVLKEKGIFLFYLYYNFENRSILFKIFFQIANLMRRIICNFSESYKNLTCDILTFLIYLPLIYFARIMTFLCGEKLGSKLLLAGYRNKNFYNIRNDCRDRFGTPLEKRYSKLEIENLLKKNGFKDVFFSDNIPFWHGYAIK